MNDYVLLKKEVDRSVLKEGLTVPLAFHELFYEALGYRLEHGAYADIILTVNGRKYNAKLKNLNFSRKDYPSRIDILQIRYTAGSGIPRMLESDFTLASKIHAFILTHN